MIKSITSIEVIKGERKYQLILESDSPLGECYDVICDMRSEILKTINSYAEKESKPEEGEKSHE